MLAKINAHPRDENITFKEDGHIYTIKGVDGHPISVTTLIHKFFPPFDADKIIDKMMRGRNWATSKYYGMTKDEIKKQWDTNRDEAATKGTAMHKCIEDQINSEVENTIKLPTCFEQDCSINSLAESLNKLNEPTPLPPPETQTLEFGYFMNFWMNLKKGSPNFKPYRTEWLVYDEEKKLAGSIDFTMIGPNGEIIILDWKRSKEIKKENPYQKGFRCLQHLDDCNYNHYCLQLNIYRHILETRYDKKIVGMFLVVFHPNNDNYLFIPVPTMIKEIQDIWNELPLTDNH